MIITVQIIKVLNILFTAIFKILKNEINIVIILYNSKVTLNNPTLL